MSALKLSRLVVLAALATGCPGSDVAEVGPSDGSADGGVTPDTGTPDTGPRDTGAPDTGVDAGCMPTGPEVCDRVDNDCNDLVDDVDVAGDGIYDCLRIGLLGNAGARGSSDFLAWLQTNGVTVQRLHTTTSTFGTDQLGEFDVVILDWLIRDYTPEEAALFTQWIEAGGGVMVMTGYSGADTDRNRPGSLLAPLGVSYRPGLVSGPVTRFNTHPTTEGLTSVTFQGGFVIDTSTAGVGTSTVVARVDQGPAGVAIEHGRGRVFVWGDEWVEFDSEWRALPEIEQFWANVLGWLAHFR